MIVYGFGKTLFGSTFIAMENGKVICLSFMPRRDLPAQLNKISKQRPQSEMLSKSSHWAQLLLGKFLPQNSRDRKWVAPKMDLQGTKFQLNVWKALLAVPFGRTTSYSEIAHTIGHPLAVRAVGSAVGANPIGYLIPCHRVLPKAGGIGQFSWGSDLKKKMLQFEGAI